MSPILVLVFVFAHVVNVAFGGLDYTQAWFEDFVVDNSEVIETRNLCWELLDESHRVTGTFFEG